MQQLNCKAGDLAIVIRAKVPANLGQIVVVLGPPTGQPFPMEIREHVWQVRSVSGRASLRYLYESEGRTESHAEGPVPDMCLRPIAAGQDSLPEHAGEPLVNELSLKQ